MKKLWAKYRQSRDEDHEEMCTTNALVVAAVAEAEASSGSRRRGSQPGRAPNEERFRESRRKNMMEDYFVERPVFSEEVFRTRYRMSNNVFNRISRDLCRYARADQCAEYCRMVKSTSIEALKRFTRGIVNLYSVEYLWPCWAGEYSGRKRVPTIILEAVASYDTWIWHAFFEMPGSFNDLNVLAKSPLFDELTAGRTPQIQFQAQEGYRKGVERCFGILQTVFSIVRGAARGWEREDLLYIMLTSITLYNMIIEDEIPDDNDEDLESDEEEANNMWPRLA
ncbi:uncharacterized protein LOC112184699 [Rosa chinensis]|uniref:uncharacterized protein LOC112184699 n=1 Tax=Rosa chinensis TaxID=74649 RepID=UPI000D090DBB|nr:uncharacterized protein LOC112184699 [Rosa chinensis]